MAPWRLPWPWVPGECCLQGGRPPFLELQILEQIRHQVQELLVVEERKLQVVPLEQVFVGQLSLLVHSSKEEMVEDKDVLVVAGVVVDGLEEVAEEVVGVRKQEEVGVVLLL
jgi:hypothetical protein